MNHTLFTNRSLLTLGPGVSVRQLAAILEPKELALPWGGCPGVKMGGYLQGGGEGNAQRVLGLGLDHVKGVDIVLANATLRKNVSASFHSDLFWALRGGGGPGGNFGIVTAFHLQPIPNPAPMGVLYFGIAVAPGDEALEAAERFFAPSPVAFNGHLKIVLGPEGGGVGIGGWWVGDLSEGHEFLDSLTAGLSSANSSIATMSLYEAGKTDFDGQQWPNNVALAGSHSLQVIQRPTRANLVAMLQAATTAPPLLASLGEAKLFTFLAGDKINEPARNATAFVHRSSLADMTLGFVLYNGTSQATKRLATEFDRWALTFYNDVLISNFGAPLQAAGPFEVYANYVDTSLQQPLVRN